MVALKQKKIEEDKQRGEKRRERERDKEWRKKNKIN